MSTVTSQFFTLNPYQKGSLNYTIITPQPVEHSVVQSAWAYAVRYTAKGLDLPDHEEAVKLMLKRHPSWQLIHSKPVVIAVNLALAENDESEVLQK